MAPIRMTVECDERGEYERLWFSETVFSPVRFPAGFAASMAICAEARGDTLDEFLERSVALGRRVMELVRDNPDVSLEDLLELARAELRA